MRKLGLKKLAGNFSTTFVRQIGAGILQLITIIAIARALGPEGNGHFSVALLLPTLLSTFLDIGLSSANTHFVSGQRISARAAFYSSLRWISILVPIGLLVGVAIIYLAGERWFPGVPASALWVALAVYPVLFIQSTLPSIFRGLQDFKIFNFIFLLQPATTLLVILGMVSLGSSQVSLMLLAFLIGMAVSGGFTSAALYCKTRSDVPKRGYFGHYNRRTIQYALKSHVSIAITFLNYRVDVYLLNLLGEATSTGLYVVSTQIAERLWLFSVAASIALSPLLSQLSAKAHQLSKASSQANLRANPSYKSIDKREKITPLIYLWVLIATGLAGIVMACVALPMVTFLFGDRYRASAVVLWLLLPGVVAWSGARVLAYDLAARDRPELNIYLNMGVLAVNVAGNLWLIPAYGMFGAAIATTVSYALFSVVMLHTYTLLSKARWKIVFQDFCTLNKQQMARLLQWATG